MIQGVDFSNTQITGGFWKEKQDLIRRVSFEEVENRFRDTYRFKAFDFDWKEGDEGKPHFFWDSDIAKWIESGAYLIKLKKDKKIEKKIDEVVDKIALHQDTDGYFNIYHTVVEPKRFENRDRHELYCAGHLMEAAVAYYDATGKTKFLDCMCKYADYIEKRFVIDKDTSFVTPGHEEIELALVRLYHATKEKRYLGLAKFFIDERGKSKEDLGNCWADEKYYQSHKPVREQKEAVGHAVRAMYLYCGMADIAYETGDKELADTCKALFDDVISKKMYVTGGIGSSRNGEAFSIDYDLENETAYAESCAALSLALFAQRMLKLENNSKYADVIERAMYNGFMSSISLDGTSFFYENPLEILPYKRKLKDWENRLPIMERKRVFDCSCCPPNILRFIASIANLLYTTDDDAVFVHQFMTGKTEITVGDKTLTITQKTKYPENGKVKISVSGGDTRLAVRVPGWCDSYKGETVNGYQYFDVKDGEEIELDFKMRVKFIEARPEVIVDCNRFAVTRGPIVYCMEGVDNGENIRDIRLDSKARFTYEKHPELKVPMLNVKAYRRKSDENTPLYKERDNSFLQTKATLIPYYAFANRGATEMQVWHFVK